MTDRVCGHCRKPMSGVASLTRDGEQHWLCHPDEGRDCYFLVTVMGHPLNCSCPGVELSTEDGSWF